VHYDDALAAVRAALATPNHGRRTALSAVPGDLAIRRGEWIAVYALSATHEVTVKFVRRLSF
jgi:hypothetical protein